MAAAGSDGKDDSGGATLRLVSHEGESFEVPVRVAQMSELVKTMTEDGALRAPRRAVALAPPTEARAAAAASLTRGAPGRAAGAAACVSCGLWERPPRRAAWGGAPA